jgi:hypothetical protein
LFALMTTEESHEIAASKAGMDPKTALKYRRLGRLPNELAAAVRGRTRPDPFVAVWDDVQKLFEDNAGLEAKTVFEFLQRQNPGRFQDGHVRTLQRLVKTGGRLVKHAATTGCCWQRAILRGACSES